jgi:hypothetical protein
VDVHSGSPNPGSCSSVPKQATVAPSGDQDGDTARPTSSLSRRAGPLSVSAIQMSDTP